MASALYFLLWKSTDRCSLLHTRHRYSTVPADVVRGITEEGFEEGTKCEGFDSETTAGEKHLNLAQRLQWGGQHLPSLIVFFKSLRPVDLSIRVIHFLHATLLRHFLQTSVWNRWVPKRLLNSDRWGWVETLNEGLRQYLNTRRFNVWVLKGRIDVRSLNFLRQEVTDLIWIAPPDIILLPLFDTMRDPSWSK